MSQPTIIYDGECRFCTWSAGRIRSLDRQSQYEVLPRQQPGLDERFPILTQSDFNTGLRLIGAGAQVHVGADAVYEIYRTFSPYHLVAWLYRVPILHSFFRLGYALIARYRHHLGRIDPELACDDEGCVISYGERQETLRGSAKEVT
ncbi:MAG: DUF393 domain-containing protein [Gemmatimonadetes bacterium]|jgi:predicted DCC family thiol-disulfide oxidoreductase YuxK|nr:DUF393 domain-containing protein [Gemmatimonadota bacterium]MBT4612663.1 DUF393 domain-containing protein [Gemmatimonadota bacterium]MBT5056184.1 DUF393 domain-containing protein [Gemmatimonadota bacterium]MBT5141425.1 DUF393 domain-containing protein [Gemmatimonadota bacterium]MBT5590658.1 DUF393 domain-containing protein [Gemmatimonadota bacterium]